MVRIVYAKQIPQVTIVCMFNLSSDPINIFILGPRSLPLPYDVF